MKWNSLALLPLVTQLGDHLKTAFEHYVALKASGVSVNTETLAGFLLVKMASWNPTAGGKTLLDDDTREAAARFLAGVAINLTK